MGFVFITSYASVYKASDRPDDAIKTELDGLFLKVIPCVHEKCTRCWHHREDVGSHSPHPELCARCVDNVDGDGEPRDFC